MGMHQSDGNIQFQSDAPILVSPLDDDAKLKMPGGENQEMNCKQIEVK